MPVAEAVRIIYQVALGLEHAYERGIIHRDIKPSNIMVTPQHKAKILDMGLARFFVETAEAAVSQLSLTHTGAVMGTVDYMAPEQAEDAHQADARSDIYSLGCTLYQCLTGGVPFDEGRVMQKLLAHREREPQPIEQLAPDVPMALASVVMRMMTKRPEDRFQRPREVAEALLQFFSAPMIPVAGGSRATVHIAAVGSAPPTRPAGHLGGADPRLTPTLDYRPTVTGPGAAVGSGTAPTSGGIEGVAPPAQPVMATAQPVSGETMRELAAKEILEAIAAAATQSPPLAAARSRQWEWTAGNIALGAVLVATMFLLAGAWYWSATDVGTLVIELPQSNRAEAKVLLDDRPVALKGSDRETISARVVTGSSSSGRASSGWISAWT